MTVCSFCIYQFWWNLLVCSILAFVPGLKDIWIGDGTVCETLAYCHSKMFWPILSYYLNWIKTSWTYSSSLQKQILLLFYCFTAATGSLQLQRYQYIEMQSGWLITVFSGLDTKIRESNFSEKLNFLRPSKPEMQFDFALQLYIFLSL